MKKLQIKLMVTTCQLFLILVIISIISIIQVAKKETFVHVGNDGPEQVINKPSLEAQ